jgi:hypothetical protein
MTAISNLFKASKFQGALAENQDLNAIDTDNANGYQETAISNNEVRNQREQAYYNKASGCSVRAQEDNLFDYKSFIKI